MRPARGGSRSTSRPSSTIPNPKLFDPDKVVTIDLSDEEFESFLDAIHIGRGSS